MSDSKSPIVRSKSDDPEMDQAAAKARKTFRYFWRELAWEYRRIIPGLQLAAVKAYFTDPDPGPDDFDGEHMWLINVRFDGRRIHGTLINSPSTLRSVKEGDQVKIKGSQLTDWMYVQGGEAYGGFTTDLLRSRMSASERKQHDDAWGFDFGDVGVVNLVPPEYIGAPPPKKRGLFGVFGGKAAQEQQDYTKVAEAEHPMSVNMAKSLGQQLGESPEALQVADDLGMTLFHQLCLAGSKDCVEACLAHAADVNGPAGNGMTPFALAKSLGWTRVMKRLQKAGATT